MLLLQMLTIFTGWPGCRPHTRGLPCLKYARVLEISSLSSLPSVLCSGWSLQGPACAADPAYAAWAVHEAPLVHCHEFNEPF